MICNVMEQKAACGFSDDAGGIYPKSWCHVPEQEAQYIGEPSRRLSI